MKKTSNEKRFMTLLEKRKLKQEAEDRSLSEDTQEIINWFINEKKLDATLLESALNDGLIKIVVNESLIKEMLLK
jgi:hypothetical protein